MQFEINLLKLLQKDDLKIFTSHLPSFLFRTSMQIVIRFMDGVDLHTHKRTVSH